MGHLVLLAGGACLYALWILFGRLGERVAPVGRALAVVARLVALVAAAFAVWQAVRAFLEPAGAWTIGGQAALGPLTLSLAFRADALSGLIILGATGLGLLVVLYSLRAAAGMAREPVYYAYLLWTLAAVSLAALANTFVVLIVAWEVATVLLYLLFGMGRTESRASAMKTFAILGFADVCLLAGAALLLAAGGDPLLVVGRAAAGKAVSTDGAAAAAAYLLMVVGALAKAGAMPLHTWIPAASEDAPTPVFALLPAALDKLLGIYLLARLTFDVFEVGAGLATVLMIVGAATILLAVFMAMVQHNLKRLLAFHAVSQVGYMVLGMGVGAAALAAGDSSGGREPAVTLTGGDLPAAARNAMAVAVIAFSGGLFHMLNHAIYKCCLFLAAGSVERAAGTMDLDSLGGMARRLPVTFLCMVVAALAISGVPPMNGFISKWLVYYGALGEGSGVALGCLVVAVFGSALTLASFVKVIHSVFLGTRGRAVPPQGGAGESLAMAVPMVVLALACVGLGVGGGWAVRELILPAAGAVGLSAAAIETGGGALDLAGGRGFWAPTAATALIIVGVAAGLLVYLATRAMRVRIVPNFVGGEDDSSDEQWHVSGTHFYETIRRLPLLGGALADAQAGALDLYRLVGHWGSNVVERLRSWHTGLLAAYASWALVGLVVLVIVLAL
jgi:formate hydrogenlyase subunit 3/multisubunit Na+/H+ antiporter MnhD subunit